LQKVVVKKILIIDNNTDRRNTLLQELSVHNDFRILSTDNAKFAAKLFKSQQIDLVITELDMPDVNGFQLLSYIKRINPSTLGMAMASDFSNQTVKKLEDIGISCYFKHPLKIQSLVNTIFEQLGINPSGFIHGITLSSFLQLMHVEQKTCTLTISANNDDKGFIHCINGETIGAQTGELTGRDAFNEIMAWDNSNIKITEGCRNTEKQIHLPLMHLLMESHRVMDEAQDDEQDVLLPPFNGLSENEIIKNSPISDRLQGMQSALFEVLGPMATIIFKDAVHDWIKSSEPSGFSIPGLLKILRNEINNHEREEKYLKLISQFTSNK